LASQLSKGCCYLKSFGGVMRLSSLSCTDVGTDRLALREWRSERCPTLTDCSANAAASFQRGSSGALGPRERLSRGFGGRAPI